ncbi:MAG: hypothetical protein JXR76_07575 [Deltaproteobacteria bacterium]|nr:hypothetical protein [Deltaproteobacteria bacterium]
MIEQDRQTAQNDSEQLGLENEFGESVNLVKTGLRELNREGAEYDYFHLPILLMSTGVERFLKAFIRLHVKKVSGAFPDENALRSKAGRTTANDVRWFVSQLTQRYFSADYLRQYPAVDAELRTLRNDERISRLIDTFADFSMGTRYYNMNIVSGIEPPGACQMDELEKLREDILEDDALVLNGAPNLNETTTVDKEIVLRLTKSCELLMRAVSRLIELEAPAQSALNIAEHTGHFLHLTDDQLGQTDYSLLLIPD